MGNMEDQLLEEGEPIDDNHNGNAGAAIPAYKVFEALSIEKMMDVQHRDDHVMDYIDSESNSSPAKMFQRITPQEESNRKLFEQSNKINYNGSDPNEDDSNPILPKHRK